MKSITRDELNKIVPKKYKSNFDFPENFDSIDWNDVDFLGWTHKSGHLGYILEDIEGIHKIWIFSCGHKKTNSKHPKMCSICFSIHGPHGVNMFGMQHLTRKNVYISQSICSDLNCNYWVRILKTNSMRETLTVDSKRLRMMIKLEEFLKRFKN